MSEDGVSAPLEVGVKLIVPKGAKIEGKVFPRLATKDRSKQPASKSGSEAEVQAWSFKNRPAKADSDHAGHLASLRLEFGQRKGGTISGNIYLCVARRQTTMFDETPTKDQRAQGSSGAHTCRLRGLACAAAACKSCGEGIHHRHFWRIGVRIAGWRPGRGGKRFHCALRRKTDY